MEAALGPGQRGSIDAARPKSPFPDSRRWKNKKFLLKSVDFAPLFGPITKVWRGKTANMEITANEVEKKPRMGLCGTLDMDAGD